MIENLIITLKDDKLKRRYKIRQAVSLSAARSAIIGAQVTGSIGQKDTIRAAYRDEVEIMADVIEVNSDNTERQPYTMRY